MRSDVCDKGMRELSKKRKERVEEDRAREEEREREDERKRREVKKAAAAAKREWERDEVDDNSRPPTVGAHGLARQDGVDAHAHKGMDSQSLPFVYFYF